MRYTDHAAQRGRERGINVHKLAQMMRKRGLTLPDGVHSTPEGSLVVKNGTIVTFLTPEMTVVRR